MFLFPYDRAQASNVHGARHRRDIISQRVDVTISMNRQLVRKACLYLVGLALTLCPPLSTFLYVRLSPLFRGAI